MATSTSATGMVYITGNSLVGVEIKNCTLDGGGTENWKSSNKSSLSGIVVDAYIKGVLLEDNEIYNCKSGGINVNGRASGCNYKGEVVASSGKNVVVRNNYLENIGANGILVNNCYEPLVEYNVVNKSHSYVSTAACAGFWPFACYGALFQYNEAYNTRTIYDGQGFDCDYNCYYTTFQYNYSHNNVGGFMLICVEPDASWMPGGYAYNVGSTVRYNISQNDYHYIFTLTGGIEKTRIYNNTIYNDHNARDEAAAMPLTKVFFEYSKGKNKLNQLEYADDLLVANNIFYLDTPLNCQPQKATNLVYKNNLHTGRKNVNGVPNGTTTYVTDKSNKPTEVVCCKESSGNINGRDAGFVAGGVAGIGRDSCGGYQLYQDSPAIGTGIYIEDGYHPCPNDFFGNPIQKEKVNIGAYGGSGVSPKTRVFDNKYKTVIDFERNSTQASGTGEMGKENSGIYRCIDAGGTTAIVDDKEKQNKATGSEKCLLLKNQEAEEKYATATFYLYPAEMEQANGVRVYLNPDGRPTSFTLVLKTTDEEGKGVEYKKTITASKTGWYTFTFAEKYGDMIATPEVMRRATEIRVEAKLPAGEYIYVDDIQANIGEMDTEMDMSFAYEEAETVKKITSFETEEDVEKSSIYGYRGSGPSELPGITTYQGKKALVYTTTASNSTGVSTGYNWKESMENIKDTLQHSGVKYDGLQFEMETAGYLTDENGNLQPLGEADSYMLRDYWDIYNISLNSEKELSYRTEAGEEKKVKSLKCSKVKVDRNHILRIVFDELCVSYTENKKTYVKYLKDFSEQEQEEFLSNLASINISYTTCGGYIQKNLTTKTYLYTISAFKGIKHTESNWRTVKEATCLEDGRREKTCENCGRILASETLPKTGHAMEKISQPATCKEDGFSQEKCKNCGYETEKVILEKTGHKSKRVVTKPATCKEDGEGYDICESCGEMLHDCIIFAKVPHEYKWVTVVEATPTKPGTQNECCIYCGEVRNTRSYTFEEKPETSEPTGTPAGTATKAPVTKAPVTKEPATKAPTKVTLPKKGAKITDKKTKAVYKITKSAKKNGTVEFVKTTDKKAKKLTIPDTVKLNGVTFKVTSIAAKACRKNTKLTTLVVGKNVTKIGKEAFYGCKNLKSVKIKTTKLTKKMVGKNIFKGIHKKAKITVPAKKKKAYQKFW